MRRLFAFTAITGMALTFTAAALAASPPRPAVSSPIPPKYQLTVSPSAVRVLAGTEVNFKYSISQLTGPNGSLCTLYANGETLPKNWPVTTAFLAPGIAPTSGSITTPAASTGWLVFSLSCNNKTVATASVFIRVYGNSYF